MDFFHFSFHNYKKYEYIFIYYIACARDWSEAQPRAAKIGGVRLVIRVFFP